MVFTTELPAHAAELRRAQPPECSPTAKTLLGLNLHFIVLTYKQPVLNGVFPRIFQAVGGVCGVFKYILGGKPQSNCILVEEGCLLRIFYSSYQQSGCLLQSELFSGAGWH